MQMVAGGKLPENEPDNTDQIIDRVINTRSRLPETGSLSSEAIELLLAAANAIGSRQGMIVVVDRHAGILISPGNRDCPYDIENKRSQAKYKAALRELKNQGLIEKVSDAIYEVAYMGYLLSDEIASSQGQTDLPSP